MSSYFFEKKFSLLEVAFFVVAGMLTTMAPFLVTWQPYEFEIRQNAVLAKLADEDLAHVKVYDQDFTFTKDWFAKHVPVWEKALARYAGQPDVQYLEIGLFEGGSSMWVLENIITHPTAPLTGIDPFEDTNSYESQFPSYPERFQRNLGKSGAAERTTVIAGFSQIEMRRLPLNYYDIIYVDGSHTHQDALEDAVLAVRLLKTGGVLIIDDYGQIYNVYRAANDFFKAFGNQFDVTHKGLQLILTKRKAAVQD